MVAKKYIESWVDVAIKDIKASVLLYNNQLYSNSFYHFQQASEKGLKAYAFYSGIYTSEKDAKRTSHYTLEIIKNSINDHQKNVEKLKQNNINFLSISEHSNELNAILDDFPKNDEVIEYRKSHICEILNSFEEMKNYKIILPQNFKQLLFNNIDEFVDSVKNFNPHLAVEIDKELRMFVSNEDDFFNFMEVFSRIINNSIKEMYWLTVLFYFALITHNHNNITRYPEGKINPLKYYNRKKALVKFLPKFNSILLPILFKLKKEINNPAL